MKDKNNYLEQLPNTVKKFDNIGWQSVAKFIFTLLPLVLLVAAIRGQ